MIQTKSSPSAAGQQLFIEFLHAEVYRLQLAGHLSLSANYRCAARRFAAFLNTKGVADIPIGKCSAALINAFQAWLWQQGVSRNTSSCYLRSLRAAWNRAIGKGTHAISNPFAEAYTGVDRTQKRAITAADIRQLLRMNFAAALAKHGNKHSTESLFAEARRLDFARDIFIFSFCARGIAFVDLAFLRCSDFDGRTITYRRRKTGQRLEIRVEPMMLKIIAKYRFAGNNTPYLFPILTAENATEAYVEYTRRLRQYNHCLRKIASLMPHPVHLTSYVSRHSWASFAYSQHVKLSIISQAMGHSSERTTEIYLKSLETNLIDSANHRLLQKIWTQ